MCIRDRLYKEGAIDPEFAVKDASKEEELIAAGKIGIYCGLFFNPLGVMKDCVANVDGADWTAVKMLSLYTHLDVYKRQEPNDVNTKLL